MNNDCTALIIWLKCVIDCYEFEFTQQGVAWRGQWRVFDEHAVQAYAARRYKEAEDEIMQALGDTHELAKKAAQSLSYERAVEQFQYLTDSWIRPMITPTPRDRADALYFSSPKIKYWTENMKSEVRDHYEVAGDWHEERGEIEDAHVCRMLALGFETVGSENSELAVLGHLAFHPQYAPIFSTRWRCLRAQSMRPEGVWSTGAYRAASNWKPMGPDSVMLRRFEAVAAWTKL